MIKVNWHGRMGNNMFQYCLGRILATELGYKLQAPAIDGFIGTTDKIEGRVIQYPVKNLEMHVIDIEELTTKRTQDQQLHLNGYFQRYEYYKERKEDVKHWMRIDDFDVGQTDKDVIMHIRLGDNLTHVGEIPFIMPYEYYEKALESMEFERLFICSDPETIHSPFLKKFDKYNPTLLRGNKMEDLRAMKAFNKIIVSQSTYSWWGAFLSEADEVFMPVPLPGNSKLINEWSSGRPDIALFVDDEDRYQYLKQNEKNEWAAVKLSEIEER